MLTQIEAREKEKTGIRNLRVGYNRVFGYYIEVAKGQLESCPGQLYPQADALDPVSGTSRKN